MYTQCPACQTVFRVTMEQLRAHDGLVRCGHCQKVFNADQQLFDDIPDAQPDVKPAAEKKRAAAKTKEPIERPTKRGKTKPPTKTKKPTPVAEKPAEVEIETAAEEIVLETTAEERWQPPTPPIEKSKPENFERISEILFSSRRRRPASAWWIAGSALLLLVLGAQAIYFYRDTLASSPVLLPILRDACTQIGCDLRPTTDVGRIELVQPTSIAAHPKYENVLRLRATMVSRSPAPQPYPLMEVTLTDNVGNILARRAFTPREYLERSAFAQSDMLPHVAVSALLDMTNPDGKASGYEINFVAIQSQ